MGNLIGLAVIIGVILAIAALRKQKRLILALFGVSLFLLIPIFLPGAWLPILGVTCLLVWGYNRMKA
jgi:hypothetical protein